jgi:hypothetical protein
MLERMEEEEEINFYEDEKWAYEESRRKCLKHLPCASFEEEGADKLQVQQEISRQHPTKVMFMGVVGKPNNQHNFDGKIAMIRISRPHTIQRDTYHHNFHHDHHVNNLIKTNWRELHIANLRVGLYGRIFECKIFPM